MDIQHDFWHMVATKVRLAPDAPLFLLASSLIKDEEGQIKWGAILNGVVTAGMVASVMSLFTMQQTLTELRTKYEGRAAQVELIVSKCLNKEPAQRYATAKDLADDLQRYLTSQRVVARRLSYTYRLAYWARRNKTLAPVVL